MNNNNILIQQGNNIELNQNYDDEQYQSQNQQSNDQQHILEYMQNLGILETIQQTIIAPKLQQEQFDQNRSMLKLRLGQQYPYTDQQFPPVDSTLSYKKSDQKFNGVSWKRLKNIFKDQEYTMMKNTKNINFNQSPVINDIYIISTLNILAQKLTPLIRIFENFDLNESGIYCCWLCIQGQWKMIIVDDNMPAIDNQYAMASCSAGLWISIIEKCIAKAYGTYNSLHGGYVNYCLTDITGCPSEISEQQYCDQWWDLLSKWFERQFLVFVETEKVPIKSNAEPLKQGYSYAVMDLQDINGEKLIMLKSPDRHFIYPGTWSYTSSKWTQSIRQQLNILQTDHDDGTFWVTLQELQTNFIGIGCSKIHDNYKHSWLPLQEQNIDKKNRFVVRFKILEETHLYMSVNQKDEKIVRHKLYEHSPVRILLAKSAIGQNGQQQFEFVGGVYDQKREVVIEEYLYPGDYVATIEIAEQNIQQDGQGSLEILNSVLSFYANNLPQNVDILQHEDLLDLQKKIIKNMALKHPQITQNIRTYAQNGQENIKIYKDMVFGLIYFYYQNNGTKKLREQVSMEVKNLQIQAPFTDSSSYSVTLSPNSETLVLYKYIPGDHYSCNSSIKAALDDVLGFEIKEQQERPSVRTSYNTRNFHNNLKTATVEESQMLNEFSQKQNYGNVDMLRFMRENAQMVKRMWDDEEIDVMVYNFQHVEGGVMMFLNYSQNTYEEVAVFELENVQIKCSSLSNNGHVDGNNVRLILNPYEHSFIFLTSINKRDPFGYKVRSYYKYYPE